MQNKATVMVMLCRHTRWARPRGRRTSETATQSNKDQRVNFITDLAHSTVWITQTRRRPMKLTMPAWLSWRAAAALPTMKKNGSRPRKWGGYARLKVTSGPCRMLSGSQVRRGITTGLSAAVFCSVNSLQGNLDTIAMFKAMPVTWAFCSIHRP